MLIEIPALLDSAQLLVVREQLSMLTFTDGRVSAGADARSGKNNEELSGHMSTVRPVNNLVMGALVNHPVYLYAGLPARVAAPIYARYHKGMKYGRHVDDPIMGQGERYRCDIAITIFLNSPDEYEGGELDIETDFGVQSVKGDAGNAVMYPASSRHQVREVTWGERLVAITWMQSLVPESEKRRILYQLYLAKETLRKDSQGSQTTEQVSDSYVNLLRMWSRV